MLRRMLIVGAVVLMCLGGISLGGGSRMVAAQGTPCAPDTNDQIAALVSQFNDAYAERSVDALAQLIAPDIARDTPRGDDAGSEAALASFGAFFEAFPDLTFTINQVLVDAPLAAVHYTATGTQATSFAGSEPTGAPVTWDGMYLLAFDCGKVTHMYSEVDQLARQGQSTSTPATPVASMESASPVSCPALTPDVATALMDTWYHDVWTGNLDLLATLTTADVYHHWAMGPDSSGQDAQRERLAAAMAIAPGATMDYDSLIVDGDSIAVHWTQTLGDDTWGGLNIFHTRCGLIDEVWSEMNISELPSQDAEATPAG